MKKRITVILSALLALTLSFAFLVGCGETPAKDETEGYPALTFVPANDGATYTVKAASKDAASGEITIPETVNGKPVTAIASKGFSGCSVTKIALPASLEKIYPGAFSNCASLTEVVIPDKITSVPKNAFYQCTSLISVTLGAGVDSIGESAFEGCAKLESVAFNNALTLIDDNAFKNCSALTEVKFPETLTSLGAEAFSHCTALKTVKLPASVENIGNFCFGYNNGDTYPGELIEAYFYGKVPSGVNQSFGYTWDAEKFIVYVPADYLSAYENADASDWNRCIVKLNKLKAFDPAEKPYNA